MSSNYFYIYFVEINFIENRFSSMKYKIIHNIKAFSESVGQTVNEQNQIII